MQVFRVRRIVVALLEQCDRIIVLLRDPHFGRAKYQGEV